LTVAAESVKLTFPISFMELFVTLLDSPLVLPPGSPAVVVRTPLVDVAAGADRRRRRRVPRWARRLAGPVLLIALWQLASSTGALDSRTLASPAEALTAGRHLFADGELQTHLWVSLQRVLWGLAFGVSAGLALAVVAGTSRLGEDLLDSTVQLLRGVPVLALTPLLIIWLGINEQPKVAMVALAVTFPIYLNTYGAIRGVDAKLVETAQVFGVGRWGLVRNVIFPGALAGFLVGLRYALAVAWLVLVISEQINATSGVGYLMMEARMAFRTDVIVVGLFIYGILGITSDLIVRALEARFLSWRRGFSGA
jgi:sulfonate transport system permease protein